MIHNIGENIKKFRKEKNITQNQLAATIRKSLRTIQKYESGEIVPPIDVINDIAKIYKVDTNQLLGQVTIPDKQEYFNLNLISSLTYDLWEETYNHSKIKDSLNIEAREFVKQDKYFFGSLMNIFIKTALTLSHTLKDRIDNKDIIKKLEPLYIKVESVDENGIAFTEAVDLATKLNNPSYLKSQINYYQLLLNNLENDIDNYELKEKLLSEARDKNNGENSYSSRDPIQADMDNF